MPSLTHIAFQTLQIAARIWMSIESWINYLAEAWESYSNRHIFRHYFVRTDGVEFEQAMTRVPKDALYFSEVAPGKFRVLYEDDEVEPYAGDPDAPVRVPWLWIGHAPSETDLTRTVQKYVIPGNFILLDLLEYLLGRPVDDGFMYMDAKTMELRKFPVEGIRIETQDDTVPDSGEVHTAS